MLCRALDAAGLTDYRVGRRRRLAVPGAAGEPRRARGRARAAARGARPRDFVGLEEALARADVTGEAAQLLAEVPQLRGGPDVLPTRPAPVADAVAGLRRCTRCSSPTSPRG